MRTAIEPIVKVYLKYDGCENENRYDYYEKDIVESGGVVLDHNIDELSKTVEVTVLIKADELDAFRVAIKETESHHLLQGAKRKEVSEYGLI